MSTISTRHRVREVESAPPDAAARERAGAIAAGLTLLLGAAAAAAYRALRGTPRPAAAASALPAAEREKVAALLEVSAAPASPGQTPRIEAAGRAVMKASTAAQLGAARLQLRQALADSGREVLAGSVACACRRAALKMGFTAVETDAGGPLPLRVAAVDAAGRALVSEIRLAEDGAITLESEVAGVHDGSCHGLMDRYEELLGEMGVRSQSPCRRLTGGVLETRAAREFVGSRLRRAARAVPVPAKASRRREPAPRATQKAG